MQFRDRVCEQRQRSDRYPPMVIPVIFFPSYETFLITHLHFVVLTEVNVRNAKRERIEWSGEERRGECDESLRFTALIIIAGALRIRSDALNRLSFRVTDLRNLPYSLDCPFSFCLRKNENQPID